MQECYKISISGQVQGVGFRPHVYTLAQRFQLKGSVSNNEEGVIIFILGQKEMALLFYSELIANPPKVSKIVDHSIEPVSSKTFEDFQIVPSEKGSNLNLQLTPDFAICDSCAGEIQDKENRRYNYPFTTCVHCGPRWAVTETFPFERENTSLDKFPMCDPCMKEYTDPANKRFHSQTNSCSTCGVQYELTTNDGQKLDLDSAEIFSEMGRLIREGNILAIKNTSGYLLCCDATLESSIKRLRINKNRPDKPFALMYPSLDMVKKDFDPQPEELTLLTSTERPIVILSSEGYRGEIVQQEVAPGLKQLGVMLPYSAVMKLFADELKVPVIATSGNLHGSPILSDRKEAEEKLGKVVDYFFHHNLEISNPQDDSVVKITSESRMPLLFRRSRGYAPNFSKNDTTIQKKIVALGGNLKSTIAFVPNDFTYVSEYLGVLDNSEVYDRFTENVSKMLNIFEAQPEVILTDKHPAYLSTQYGKELAKKKGIEYLEIQHHKAHFAAVLGEHELFDLGDKVLGVVWDGTGYGDDSNIWGGEFFLYEEGKMERVAHFDYFEWMAGDKMAKDTRLPLFSLSEDSSSEWITDKFSTEEIRIYDQMKKNNTLKTSSVGRIFDAVASLLGIADSNQYEGQAAILMESRLSGVDLSDLKCYVQLSNSSVVPTHEIWNCIVADFQDGLETERILANFIYTLASVIEQMSKLHGVKKMAFSGGVFQNTILIDMINRIVGDECKLYFHRNLSPNDENISLGQLMYYVHCTPYNQ
ncbi:carbamoyltransferase HypF [Aureitalea sp. L0-47]|uniref:carbamoyltransferase HypF n=1 Tax=Aureitalea sp. L0-47 TaxID=2816962 RepID=UPI002237188A|nr:carbamoyltransferase HypF [Aureitalea sp. L0-47]MCW5519840.1 carbamoyltransferase HypF [Aureitalea sp. L0-47]